MTTENLTPGDSNAPQNGVDSRARLDQLARELRAFTGGDWTHRNQSLDHVHSVGPHLLEARAICIPRQKGVQPPKSWTTWLKEVDIKRQVAHVYLRIFKNWDIVKHLKGKGRTQRAALRIIADQPSAKPRPKTITVKLAALVAVITESGLDFGDVADPLALEKIANRILELVGTKKIVKVDAG